MLLGCGDDEGIRPPDANYFPLRKGFYQIYDVHQVTYRVMEEYENITYQLKTEVVDSFQNDAGGYTYTIHRSRRNTAADPWVFQQVWSVWITPTRLVVREENVSFIHIAFPAIPDRTWNGNALNSLPADDYTLTETGNSYELQTGETVGPYIRIVQEDEFDIVTFMDRRHEVYAENIGLVHKEITDLEYCSTQGQCEIGGQVIDNGLIYVQTLVAYGQN